MLNSPQYNPVQPSQNFRYFYFWVCKETKEVYTQDHFGKWDGRDFLRIPTPSEPLPVTWRGDDHLVEEVFIPRYKDFRREMFAVPFYVAEPLTGEQVLVTQSIALNMVRRLAAERA